MGSTVHVVPVADLIGHETNLGDSCPCGTTTEHVKRADGSSGWIVIHNSLDGREKSEAA